jgi:hypothetical protein
MIRKQRNNKNIIVEDLYVGNTLYEGDNIFKGWHEHFHNLAQPSDDPDFDTRFKQQCQQVISLCIDYFVPFFMFSFRFFFSNFSTIDFPSLTFMQEEWMFWTLWFSRFFPLLMS